MNRRWDWSAPKAVSRPWTAAIGGLVGLAMIGVGRPWAGGTIVAVSAAVTVATVLWPTATARALRTFSEAIGRVLGFVALTAVFGLVIVPLAMIRRGDRLGLRFPDDGPSFWQKRPPREPDSRRRWS